MEKQDRVREFVQGVLARKGDRRPFADDEALLSVGRMDSLDVLEIVEFLEQSFGVDFAEQGFDQGRFNTVTDIAALVDG